MINILYISKKEEIFLNAYIKSLDYRVYNINILDLKHCEYINCNNALSIKLLNINWTKNRFVRYLVRYVCAIKFLINYSNEKFDICHILGIKRDNFWIIPWLKIRSKKLIITVYGRSTYTYLSKRFLFSFVYKYVNLFAFSNQSLIDEFLVINKKIDRKKTVRIIPPILNIKLKGRSVSKQEFESFLSLNNIRKDLIKISCSSTVASYDQHDKIIDSISRIKNKEKVQLLFLLTYGGTDTEKERIINRIKNDLSDFDYKIFDHFLTDEELACYRANTDIYINMRTSDQLAGAIIESLYEGALLISGKWLNYQTFDDIGVFYKTVNNFEELSQCIDSSIEDFIVFRETYSSSNIEKISGEFSIESVMERWNRIYQG